MTTEEILQEIREARRTSALALAERPARRAYDPTAEILAGSCFVAFATFALALVTLT